MQPWNARHASVEDHIAGHLCHCDVQLSAQGLAVSVQAAPREWPGDPKPKWGMLQYQHDPVPAMDGGFAMSLGFAWTQRNLLRRIDILRISIEKG